VAGGKRTGKGFEPDLHAQGGVVCLIVNPTTILANGDTFPTVRQVSAVIPLLDPFNKLQRHFYIEYT
jgi:hypothetical protein